MNHVVDYVKENIGMGRGKGQGRRFCHHV